MGEALLSAAIPHVASTGEYTNYYKRDKWLKWIKIWLRKPGVAGSSLVDDIYIYIIRYVYLNESDLFNKTTTHFEASFPKRISLVRIHSTMTD